MPNPPIRDRFPAISRRSISRRSSDAPPIDSFEARAARRVRDLSPHRRRSFVERRPSFSSQGSDLELSPRHRPIHLKVDSCRTSECTDQLAGKDVKLVVLKDVAERPPSINRHNSPFHHFGRSCRQTSAFSEDASDSQGQSPSEMHTTRRYYRGFRTTRRRRGVRTSRPLMHPKVKEMAEQFFEKMRDAQPAQTLTNALTVTKKSFKTNAFSIVRLAIAFSLCNVGYHLIFSGLYAQQVGGWAWSLCIPVGIFYTIMCMVIVSAISSISSMDETVNIQADNLVFLFKKITDMETTFWEQSEAISQHVAQLEKLTARLEQQEQSPNGKRNQIPPEMIQRLEEKLERALMAAASNGGQDLTAANEVRSVLDELHSWSEELNDSARDSLAKAKRSSNDERESITRSLLAANEVHGCPRRSEEQPSPFTPPNQLTKPSQWTRSERVLRCGESSGRAHAQTPIDERSCNTVVQTQPTGPKPTGLPPGWRTAQDEHGMWYFYHKSTRQPQWERPPA